MSSAVAKSASQDAPTLSERFWSLANDKPVDELHPDDVDPAAVVKHTLAILDAIEREESGDALSVNTVCFLKLLRQHELGGELSYASPEQIRGETMDERSLVFSVGVLLFERLTGRHPFGAENNQPRRLARIRRGEFGSGVNYFPTVSASLRSILMRCMGPFPEERYATLTEMRSNLENYMQQTHVPPRLPGTHGPGGDSQATRVVDMSKIAQGERAVAHLRAPVLREADVRQFDEPTIGDSDAPARAMERAQTTVLQRRTTQRATPASSAAPTDDELFSSPADTGRRFMPFVYAAAGAAAASILFFAIGARGGSDTSPPKSAAHMPATPAAAAQTDSAEPAAVAHTIAAPPTPANAPTIITVPTSRMPPDSAEAETSPAETSTPTAPQFDAKVGGERIVAIGRACFTEDRLRRIVGFGLGVAYPINDETPRKLFFSGSKELSRAERRCLAEKLAKLTPGALPSTPKVVDYWLKLSTSSHTVVVKTKL